MAETWQEKQKAAQDFLAWRARQERDAPTTPMGPIPPGALVPLLVEEATRRSGIPNWSEDNPDTPSLYPTDKWAREKYWANQQVTPPRPTQTQTTTTPAATTPVAATQEGLISGMSPDERAGISAGGLINPPPPPALTSEDAEVNDIAKLLETEASARAGDLTPLRIAEVVSGSTEKQAKKTPEEVLYDLGDRKVTGDIESRRKQYMKDMNDIFTKSMMLKVLANLSGSDGEDMSKMFMQFAFQKMDANKEFSGEERLKELREIIFFTRDANGNLVHSPPKFRGEAFDRCIAGGGNSKDCAAITGHLQQKKQPTDHQRANLVVFHRGPMPDGSYEEQNFRPDVEPPKVNPPWLRGSKPVERAGAVSERAISRARQQIADGDEQGAMQTLMLHYGNRSIDQFGRLINPTVDQARQAAVNQFNVLVNPALHAKIPDASVPSTTGSGGETRVQVIARITREHSNKSEEARANMIISELERLGLE